MPCLVCAGVHARILFCKMFSRDSSKPLPWPHIHTVCQSCSYKTQSIHLLFAYLPSLPPIKKEPQESFLGQILLQLLKSFHVWACVWLLSLPDRRAALHLGHPFSRPGPGTVWPQSSRPGFRLPWGVNIAVLCIVGSQPLWNLSFSLFIVVLPFRL